MTLSKKTIGMIVGLVLAVCLLLLCIFLLMPGSDPGPSGDPTGNSTEATGDTQPQQTETQPLPEISYPLTINGQQWDEDTTQMALTDADAAELAEYLPYLPNVQAISLDGKLPEMDALQALIDAYPEIDFSWQLEVCGVAADINTTRLELTDADAEALAKALPYLPKLKNVSLDGKLPKADALLELAAEYSEIAFFWQFEVCGVKVDIDTTELELTDVDAAELSDSLPYLPKLKKVSLDGELPMAESLLHLVNAYQNIEFYWQLEMCGVKADTDTTELEVTNADTQELSALLSYLPKVKTVELKGTLPKADDLNALTEEFPVIEFNWEINICGVDADADTTELELKNATAKELNERLPYLPKLKKVTLTGTLPKADELKALTKTFSKITFHWQIEVCGVKANNNTTTLDLSKVTLTSLTDVRDALGYLPKLKTLNLTGYHKYSQIAALQSEFKAVQIVYTVTIGGKDLPLETQKLELKDADIQELTQNLPYLPNVTEISFSGTLPQASALNTLMETYPDISFSWQYTVHGVKVNNNTTSLDLSKVTLTDLTEVEKALPYLPKLKTLNLTGYHDYAKIQALNKAYPSLTITYTVNIGGKSWPLNTTSMTLNNVDTQELTQRLPYLTKVQNISLTGTLPSAAALKTLTGSFPVISFYWQIEILGIKADVNTTKLDFSGIPLSTVSEVEAALGYLPSLKKVTLIDCGIPESELEALSQRHPQIRFVWYLEPGPTHVEIGGIDWPIDTESMTVRNANLDELNENLPYLTQLTYVGLEGTLPDSAGLKALVSNFPYVAFYWQVNLAGIKADVNTTKLELTNATAQELTKNLPYLPNLTYLSLAGTLPDSATLRSLTATYPNVQFYWQIDVYGIPADVNTVTLDLSNIPMDSVATVENAVGYLPSLKKVIMCDCGISNEEMDALGKRNPSVRFVWKVSLGSKLSIRTDATSFISPSESIWLSTADAYNFRYCVDMVCLDLGHHPINNIDFVRYMPNLRYLIIADCNVSDLSPLSNKLSLVYLEAFINPVTDYSPLLTCTNLKDLNLCFTYGNVDPLMQMTWLERLWWSPYRDEKTYLWDALPNTQINITTAGSTAEGWRTGYLYYEMRDYLGMGYMTH